MTVKNERPEWLSAGLYPFEDKWLEIDGNTIHYIDEGKGDVILFSHAAIGWSFMYRNIIKALAQSYRCIALDFPGFGLSRAGKNYTFSVRSQAGIVNKFVAALRLKDLFVLGHDTGGPSAFYAFGGSAANVRGFIISDAIIFPVTEYKKISILLGVVSTALFRFMNRQFNILVGSGLKAGFKNGALSPQEKDAYLNVSGTSAARDNMARVLSSLKKDGAFMASLRLSFETSFNKKPALLIYGEKDPLNAMGIPQRIEGMLKSASLKLIPGEAHFPHEGEAEQIAILIENWVKNIIRVQTPVKQPS